MRNLNGLTNEMTNLERISNGECISPRGVDHCTTCIDCCEASHFKFAIQDLVTNSVCAKCGGSGIIKGGPTDSRPDEPCTCKSGGGI